MQRTPFPWTILTAALLAGPLLWCAPEALTRRVHAITVDALRPGWGTLNAVRAGLHQHLSQRADAETQALRVELARAQAALAHESERVQRLTAQLTSLHDTGGIETAAFTSSASEERLFVPALVPAAVLGETTAQAWREGRVLDRGWKHGVRETALVLQGRGPLIDLGAAAEISPEDPLLAGRTIIGKVTVVGRWTSMFLPVTDPEYRGRAQLVRESERGPVWGAAGLLRGDGNGRCRLDGVPVEEAVRVGDLVFSAERDGALFTPLSYGRVVDAKALPEAREWTLIVEPVATPQPLTHVHVLRAALNPARIWVH